ncbi:MAG: hypothetical protein QM676_14915 [Novosphingobium sp.]
MRHSLALALVPLGLAFAPAVSAQDAGEKVNQLIVYGDDPCPASTEGEITVCARKSESERYRIPAPLRETGDLQKNESWNNKVLAYETVGSSGTRSCSPVGAGGWTGCANKLIDNAYAEKRESTDVRFGELIQAERERRLASIDQEAAETQSRVEQAEKEYEARQRAAQSAPASDEAPAAPSPATPPPGP